MDCAAAYVGSVAALFCNTTKCLDITGVPASIRNAAGMGQQCAHVTLTSEGIVKVACGLLILQNMHAQRPSAGKTYSLAVTRAKTPHSNYSSVADILVTSAVQIAVLLLQSIDLPFELQNSTSIHHARSLRFGHHLSILIGLMLHCKCPLACFIRTL